MTSVIAFEWTRGELAWAVPVGVVLGALIAAVASWMGATRGAKAAARLSTEERFWDARKELYVRVARAVNSFTDAILMRNSLEVNPQLEVLNQLTPEMQLLASDETSALFLEILRTLVITLGTAEYVNSNSVGHYYTLKWLDENRSTILNAQKGLTGALTSDLRSKDQRVTSH